MTPLDRRLNAYRPDLADIRLEGQVSAERFVAGRPMRVRAPVVDLKPRPAKGAGTDTQLLMGDTVRVFDTAD
ncbi:peptidase P60, partial [Rhizobiaceae bacterium]|nr:peptidase P60 [Rhizobiaceae bacterium]